MQVTETSAEGLKHEYRIVIDAEDMESRIAARLEQLRKTIRLPGFRPGKVPVTLLRQRYGPSLMGEVLDETVSSSTQAAIIEKELHVALQPKVELEKFEEGGDLAYTMSVELMPTIEPADLSKISVERVVAVPGKVTVNDAVQRLADAQKTFSPAPAGRKAAKGDTVKINFVGTIDGEAFEGGASEESLLELGSESFIPGFEDQLVGAKAGEHVEVKVTFPENYASENLAGKEAIFAVDVLEVQTVETAAVDDALAERLGLENLDAVTATIKDQLVRDYATISKLRVKREVMDALADTHDFEVPPGMAEREFDSIWAQIEDAKARGEEDPADAGQSEEELKEQYRAIAERRVRLGLLLAEVGRRNNIEVSPEEVNRAMSEQAARFGGQEQEVLSYYRGNPQAAEQLKGPIFEDKVMDFILEIATVTEREVSPDDLMADPDGEATVAKKASAKKVPAKKAKTKGEAKAKEAAKPKPKPKPKPKGKATAKGKAKPKAT